MMRGLKGVHDVLAAKRFKEAPSPFLTFTALEDGRLLRAREHCFLAGVGDSGMKLCEAVVPYGIAKIHYVQERLGLPPDATLIGAPDATVTRNRTRWRQGFGYGGVTAWTGDFVVLDIKSNACGMLVGALPGDSPPPAEEVRAVARRLQKEGLEMDGVPLDFDLQESNHFVDLFEVVPSALFNEPPPFGARYFFIMHSSGHEHRGPSSFGPGLYFDESEELRRAARRWETPWGSLSILAGDDARAWYDYYLRIQNFSHLRRETFARALFGEFRVVCNETHQGLVRAMSQANLGCYTYEAPLNSDGLTHGLYPLTLSATLPAYLVRGRLNFRDQTIQRLGWGERAERHGLLDRLRDTNLLPHGGGYTYPDIVSVSRVVQDGPDLRRFRLKLADGTLVEMENPRDLRYMYRGDEVRAMLQELDLGELRVQLRPLYVL